MRIDFVFPKFKLLSGAERLILSLARELADRGHRIRLLCHSFDESCRPVAEGLLVEETGTRLDWTGNHYIDSISSYVLSFRLRHLIASDTDVVCLFGPALPLAAVLGRSSRRILYFCYEPPRALAVDKADVLERVGSWRGLLRPVLGVYRRIDRWLVRRVDAILTTTDFARGLIRAEYDMPSVVVTPGVSIPLPKEDRSEARNRLGLDVAERVALNVNFLHPRKRVDLLLRAWAGVEKHITGARLLIVGDGPERNSLRALAREFGLERITFAGYVPESMLPLYYVASDLLVHVTRQETFGLTIVEAGAFGLPAIAVDEGGPRETILQGETGLRIPAEEASIANALVALLSDPQRSEELGARAREHVLGRYTWQRGADDFLNVCGELETPASPEQK